MCGIAGILYADAAAVSRETLLAMLPPLALRGPDGQGTYVSGRIALGHTRLSIIDLAGGAQPIHNEDKTTWVVFNGEIFNYVELRAELIAQGHRFYTHSDTEVIVHLYDRYGLDFVHKLNGQFAIALWDTRQQRLVLVRDRPGILPLFYAQQADRLIFGSEIKAMLPALGARPSLNLAALDQTFTFWSPVGGATIFNGIEQLPPGCMLVAEQGRVKCSRYWDWTFAKPGEYLRGSVADLAAQLRELMQDSTRIRLRADVPVAAYLSGGLDSSILVGMVRAAGIAPNTFSLGFADPQLDETEFQAAAATHFGVTHRSYKIDDEQIRRNFTAAVWRAETPFLRCAPIPMMALSGHAHRHDCKVVLTGEGADEVFGGYDIFKEAKIRRFWAKRPDSAWRPRLLQRLYPYLNLTSAKAQAYSEAFFGAGLDSSKSTFFTHAPRWNTTAQCKMMLSEEVKQRMPKDAIGVFARDLPADFGSWDAFNQGQYVEAKTLLANYLLCSQGDRMLMANSVEGRFPYLDHRVIEFANALDPRLKMHVLDEKYLLKQALGDLIPPQVLQRKKQPYRAPDSQAFATGDVDFVEEALSLQSLKSTGYFDAERVRLLWRKVQAGRAVSNRDSMAFVGVLSTQVWHRLFVEGRPIIEA
jgi:asparagine synthase (glutamine-hydrolysing)